jgi:23S rRNA (uracil1939-C5)-methyltransferase
MMTGDQKDAVSALALALMKENDRLVGVQILRGEPGDNVILRGQSVTTLGRSQIEEELLGFRHAIGALSFFQVNPVAAQVLFSAALDLIPPEVRSVFEGYAGVGALTLPLLKQVGTVHAVESNPEAASALCSQTLPGLTSEQASVPEVLRARLSDGNYGACVFDPPRRGLEAEVIETLKAVGPKHLIVLHCSLKAFERDARHLHQVGYGLRELVALDQFPRTAHVETVALFSRHSP